MKRGTTPTLQIEHDLDMSTVSKVEFLFKQNKLESGNAVLIKTYPDDVTENDGKFNIPFTGEETRLFASNRNFYCDPKITLSNGMIPATEILELSCSPTLWGDADG